MLPSQIEGFDNWIEDLRSNKYSQGRGSLAGNGEYCVLGVYAKGRGWEEWDLGFCIDGARMRYGIGSYMPFGIQSYITELNDTYEWSFEDMADLLEDCIAGDCWWPVIYEFDGHLMYEESVEHRPNYLC